MKNPKENKNVKCPICHNDRLQVLWTVNSLQAAQHFVLQERDPERFSELVSCIKTLWKQDSCEVVLCNKCGFCFSNPFIAGNKLFYNIAFTHPGYPSWKWEFQITYNILKKYTGNKIKILEIGAGDGAFIRRIAENISSKENILCTEFSEHGRHMIEKFGVQCLSDDIRDLSDVEFKKKFDIICMFQVLEHMDRLDVLFQKLNWLIKNGGSLFIAVPNSHMINFNEHNGALLDMPPHHIGRWNKECFEEIGKQNGFYVENYKIEGSKFIPGVIQFVFFRLLRKSQQKNSFENKILRIKNPHLHRIMLIVGFAINSVTAIPIFLKKMNRQIGNGQWVHFIKIKEQ